MAEASSMTPRRAGIIVALGALVLAPVFAWVSSAAAQESTTTTSPTETTVAGPAADGPTDEQLTLGATVFASNCAACHQPGGVGVPGQFPPLKDNPNVQDAAYVRKTVENGRSGTIKVNGETYNGVMPAVSGLDEADLDAVIAYVQSGFKSPAGAAEAIDPAAGLVEGSISGSVNFMSTLAQLIGLAVAAMIIFPRLAASRNRLETTWLDAWLKAALILIGVVVFVLIIPNAIIKASWFTDLNATLQEVLGSGIWAAGLGLVLWSLWFAHNKKWI